MSSDLRSRITATLVTGVTQPAPPRSPRLRRGRVDLVFAADVLLAVIAGGMFGVWHIRPAVGALRINGLATGRAQLATRVAAIVATTAAGGALFSWLRARSGSLATPVLLHLATNCAGPVAAWMATRPKPRTRPEAPADPGGLTPQAPGSGRACR